MAVLYARETENDCFVPVSMMGRPDADYIVDQGTDGIWTYRKWNSGIAECWGILSVTVTAWNAWGNLYEGASDTRYANFPTGLFNNAPMCTASYNGGGVGGFLETYLAPTTERTATYIPLRPNTASSPSTFNITIHAIGTWK